jgi:sec-independent protein translocase protein TatA
MVELLVILIAVLLLFGAGRLPAIGEGLGKAVRGFKDSMRSSPPRRGAPPGGAKELPPGDGSGG